MDLGPTIELYIEIWSWSCVLKSGYHTSYPRISVHMSMLYGGFLKSGYPQIINVHGIFPNNNHLFLGTPMTSWKSLACSRGKPLYHPSIQAERTSKHWKSPYVSRCDAKALHPTLLRWCCRQHRAWHLGLRRDRRWHFLRKQVGGVHMVW